uniref:Uncharacterized protein n=1 Tax=Chenopodium quinoa TaxID=63459 RepID=A0A803MQR7_CHEQI
MVAPQSTVRALPAEGLRCSEGEWVNQQVPEMARNTERDNKTEGSSQDTSIEVAVAVKNFQHSHPLKCGRAGLGIAHRVVVAGILHNLNLVALVFREIVIVAVTMSALLGAL